MSDVPFVADLDEVCRITEDLARTLPPALADTARGLLLRHVDSSGAMARVRESIPCLPPVYETMAATFDLFGMSLGYFQFWPSLTKARTLGDALVEAFEARSERWVAEHDDLIEVGSHVGDPVCVVSSASVQADRVVILDHSNPKQTDPVATDIEQLMILAGNVVAIRMALNAGDIADPRSALAHSVAALCGEPEINETWRRLGYQAF